MPVWILILSDITTVKNRNQIISNSIFTVATSTANLLDARDSETDTDSEDQSQFGKQKIVIKYYSIMIWKIFINLFVSVQRGECCSWWGRWTARLAGRLLAHHVSHVCFVSPLQEESQCPGSCTIVTCN